MKATTNNNSKNVNTSKNTSNKKANNGNRVNTSTITPIAVSSLSDFHKASFELAKLSEKHATDKKNAQTELDKAKESRAKDPSVSIAKALGKLDQIEKKYKDDCAPLRQKQRDITSMIDDSFYYAYKIAMAKGDAKSTGKVEEKRGETTTVHTVTSKNCFYAYTKDFLEKLGVSNLDNELAMDKVAKILVARCSGRTADRKTGMTKDRNKSTQKDLFVRAIIQYLVEDRHCLVQGEDWSLSRKNSVSNTEA